MLKIRTHSVRPEDDGRMSIRNFGTHVKTLFHNPEGYSSISHRSENLKHLKEF
jgi:hypothetical protein